MMAKLLFAKGRSGNPAGRPKGSQNKLRYEVGKICEEYKCNPFAVLAQIAEGVLKNRNDKYEKTGARLRMEAAAELAQYLAPKLKAVELSTKDNAGLNFYFNSPLPDKEDEDAV